MQAIETPKPARDHPATYQIRVAGLIGARWHTWFLGMAIASTEHGETVLTGVVADQAALYGLLRKVRNIGMILISVNRVEVEAKECS